jgi:hypothetical protein
MVELHTHLLLTKHCGFISLSLLPFARMEVVTTSTVLTYFKGYSGFGYYV